MLKRKTLCKFCKERKQSLLPLGKCYICGDASKRMGVLVEKALLLMKPYWKCFAISTNIPHEWIIAEEDIWDLCLSGESVKHAFNSWISQRVAELSGKRYNPVNPDGRLRFDFQNFTVSAQNEPLFIFGRYKKLKGGISQSAWPCSNCKGKGCQACGHSGKKYDSIEEKISNEFLRVTGGKGEFHASGREDVDALNSAGRPFVLEIKNPATREVDLNRVKKWINRSKEISVSDLRVVNRGVVQLVSDSHFDKEYEAVVECDGEITRKDMENIKTLHGAVLLQRTPLRVAHRRSDLVRKRKILSLTVKKRGKRVVLKILAEAGTYIKEFISGDGRRTKPSISDVVGKNCSCISLKVTRIYDDFLKLVVG